MPLDVLNKHELDLLGRALTLMASGSILEEIEFGTRMGVELAEFRELIAKWPAWNDVDDNSQECIAINNMLNDLLHGVGITERQCAEMLGASRSDLLGIYHKWAASRGWSATGVK